MLFFSKFNPNFQRILLKIWQFLLRFRSRNLYKMFAQNAGNRISEVLDFKILQKHTEELCITQLKPWIRPYCKGIRTYLLSKYVVDKP